MLARRFGRNIKLPSTRAIKHQVLTLVLQDYLKAEALEAKSDEHLVFSRSWCHERANTIETTDGNAV
jgi:hypothetical protein